MTETTNTRPRYAGLFRRLFAIFYDSFLLLAILFIVSALATALNHGKAVEPGDALYPVFVILIFSLSYLYFAWFWIHGGQSLGMKTWHIQLQSSNPENNDNKQIDWKIAAIRFFSAIVSWGVFGLGFLWSLFDRKNRSWHDIVSKTVLIDLRASK
ncbi:MAG: RDD family protein [Gammaproteobacteria bacterium]|nr:MAG: RDD family protein [Gammaproteobacteria bacterium]